MRALLLLCAVIGVCVSGAYGARRRFGAGPPRPVQRRPSGWREFQPNERLDFQPEFRRSAPREQLRLAPQEPFRLAPREQPRQEPAAPVADDWPVRGPVVEEREDPAPEPLQPLEPLEPQRSEFAPAYSEPEAAADSAPEQYSITIPEKTEKNRLEFQVHGQQGPHSYRFGYDTGSG
ncbi:uncharacterized protein LOC119101328 [Pollicipes pollicipes]|nr:uncharacterized protein LOC119101328 [Pollicipes pollicipes]